MRILDCIKPLLCRKSSSAGIAKERLQIIVAHQRAKNADTLPMLKEELMKVISKHLGIEADKIQVELEKRQDASVLELNITLPEDETDGATAAG